VELLEYFYSFVYLYGLDRGNFTFFFFFNKNICVKIKLVSKNDIFLQVLLCWYLGLLGQWVCLCIFNVLLSSQQRYFGFTLKTVALLSLLYTMGAITFIFITYVYFFFMNITV